MAPSRLDDSQKSQLVERFQAGESSQQLAEAFGCSAATVSRILRAALEPAVYEALRNAQRQGAGGRSRSKPSAKSAQAAVNATKAPVPAEVEAIEAEPADPPLPGEVAAEGSHLAIDDADDFGDDETDFELELEDSEAEVGEQFVVVPLLTQGSAAEPVLCQPLADARLPASLYMLVDKTVELQARPLRECPELGPLPDDEVDRQALVLFSNPRQAKRHCGRSQRVIKMPDPHLLERTAPYLLAQGISRLVVEGSLYSLPGS